MSAETLEHFVMEISALKSGEFLVQNEQSAKIMSAEQLENLGIELIFLGNRMVSIATSKKEEPQ